MLHLLEDCPSVAEAANKLTASPQCPFPDHWLNGLLSTGLFDHVRIQFYMRVYSSNPDNFKKSWNLWTPSITAGKFFCWATSFPCGCWQCLRANKSAHITSATFCQGCFKIWVSCFETSIMMITKKMLG